VGKVFVRRALSRSGTLVEEGPDVPEGLKSEPELGQQSRWEWVASLSKKNQIITSNVRVNTKLNNLWGV